MPVSVQQLRDARTVTLSTGEQFEFAWVDPETATRLAQLSNEPVADRDYLASALSALLRVPALTEAQLSSWPDERLQALTVGYLNFPANKGRRDDEVIAASSSMSECRQALQETLGVDIEQLNESARQVVGSLTKNAWKFGLETPPITSPLLDMMRTSPLLQFDQIASAHAALIEQVTSGFTAQLQESVDRMIEQQTALTRTLRQIAIPPVNIRLDTFDLLGQLDFSRLVPVLDSWSLIQRSGILDTLADVHKSRRAALLIEADLEFLNDLVDEAIEQVVDDAVFMGNQQQRAYVGRRLRDFTASVAFIEQLEQELTGASRAQRRRKIVRSAHQAHQARQYALSVPALYAQVEGLLADCLHAAGKLRWSRKYRRWVVIDPVTGKDRLLSVRKTGAPKATTKPDTVSGLDRLTALAKGDQSVAVSDTVSHIRDGIASVRNQVMHGTKTDYATARSSTRLLLVALILARQLRQLQNAGPR